MRLRTTFFIFFVFVHFGLIADLTPLLNLKQNQYLKAEIKEKIKPYCLPEKHSLVKPLNKIFSSERVITNEESFVKAGFQVIYNQPGSYIRVARHPDLPGYIIKLYLDDELRKRNGIDGWVWLVNRCIGAENVRKLIKRKKLKYFSVPDKWVYPLPAKFFNGSLQQPILLIAEDMNLVSDEETKNAWRRVHKKEIKELFSILNHGYSSCYLGQNIPYTKTGKFSCIDTEHPKRKHKLDHVQSYLSPEMKKYWLRLMKK